MTALYEAYDDWLVAIAKWLDVTSGTVFDSIPDFIRLSEIELDKRLRLRQSIKFVTTTIDNDGVLTLPADIGRLRTVVMSQDCRTLDVITPDRYGDAQRLSTGTGITGALDDIPTSYMINGNKLHFMPLGADLDVILSYYRKVEPLGPSVPNNIYTNYAAECLLGGAVMYGMKMLFEEDRQAFWAARFDKDIETLSRSTQQEEFGSSPLVARVPLRRRVMGYR